MLFPFRRKVHHIKGKDLYTKVLFYLPYHNRNGLPRKRSLSLQRFARGHSFQLIKCQKYFCSFLHFKVLCPWLIFFFLLFLNHFPWYRPFLSHCFLLYIFHWAHLFLSSSPCSSLPLVLYPHCDLPSLHPVIGHSKDILTRSFDFSPTWPLP